MVNFVDMIRTLANFGVWDVVLPFMLIFTIIYMVLTSVLSGMFGKSGKGDNAKDNTKFAMVIAMVIALGVVIPHVTNSYPQGMDVVNIINTALPQVAVIAVAIVGMMILLGLFNIKILDFHQFGISSFIVIVSVGLIIYIFGEAAGWFWRFPNVLGFMRDKDFQSLLIAILVFGLIIRFITGSGEKKKGFKDNMEGIKKGLFNPFSADSKPKDK